MCQTVLHAWDTKINRAPNLEVSMSSSENKNKELRQYYKYYSIIIQLIHYINKILI